MSDVSGIRTIQTHPATEPRGHLVSGQNRRAMVSEFEGDDDDHDEDASSNSIARIMEFASAEGDISDLLDEGRVAQIGVRAIDEWHIDQGSREHWLEVTERGLSLAAQESDDDDAEKDYPFDNASDLHYPILTTAANEFNARAYAELVKGDKAFGVKVFNPPPRRPDAADVAQVTAPQPPPPNAPPQAQMAAQQDAQTTASQVQADQQKEQMANLADQAKQARGERVAHYLNFLTFYRMDNWEGETDALLQEVSIAGSGFKKVYMGASGLCSDYVSAMRLTVHNDTKSMAACPRITQDFDIYPTEIEERIRSGRYRDVELTAVGVDPEASRVFIEQLRMEDLDEDGLREPYIVTVDVLTQQTMRIEAAYSKDDVFINENKGRVVRIERWVPFAPFQFLPDPRGRFYGIGLARLLDNITDAVDTSINQLMDAGNAQIAGGGFMGSNVRLQGSGQGGNLWFRPGEYQTVNLPGGALQDSIWERTTPSPSPVTFQMLEMLLGAAKDIASIKDVITGDTPATAPVGTTLALQSQALQVYSSIFKRIYRGMRDEGRLMYKALKKWGGERERKEYAELTGGDFDKDFSGDGTDIQPIADPSVVTKMQKVSRIQAVLQLAESPIGLAAGMQSPGPAQTLVKEALETLDWDRPERFIGPVAPNPLQVAEVQAKTQDMAAAAQLKLAQAGRAQSGAQLDQAKGLREVGLAAHDAHSMHQLADQIASTGSVAPPPEGETDAPASAPPAAA